MIAKERLSLAAVYGTFSVVLTLVARGHSLAPAAAATFIATLWLGFVLAISFMEAWVKFRAPFLPRYLALDVGRTVFAALNTVEAALAGGLVLLHVATSLSQSSAGVLVTLVVLLALQTLWFYPRLELRGEYALVAELKKQKETSFTPRQHAELQELQSNVHSKALPHVAFHIAYVLGEVVKVVLLASYAFGTLKSLSKQ